MFVITPLDHTGVNVLTGFVADCSPLNPPNRVCVGKN